MAENGNIYAEQHPIAEKLLATASRGHESRIDKTSKIQTARLVSWNIGGSLSLSMAFIFVCHTRCPENYLTYKHDIVNALLLNGSTFM